MNHAACSTFHNMGGNVPGTRPQCIEQLAPGMRHCACAQQWQRSCR